MPSSCRTNQNIEREPLGQLLAAHTMLHLFPSNRKMGEFICRAIESVPGTASCGLCIHDLSEPLGDLKYLKEDQCTACAALQKGSKELVENCLLADQEELHVLGMKTAERSYGYMLLRIESPEEFRVYEPFLKNFANAVAITLENRWQKEHLEITNEELRRFRDHLEEQVNDYTIEQQQTNITLRTEITMRNQAEKQQVLYSRILTILNQPIELKDTLKNILSAVKNFTGFSAVGIRIREGEDFPYFVTLGFPAGFVEADLYLCARNSHGEIERDSEGNVYLECMCGNILCGRTDPSKEFFTSGGSFWCNNTSRLMAETSDEDHRTRRHNRCNSAGYESVALIPLKAGDETIGLLQLNDKDSEQFTIDQIQFFEKMGNSIGITFSRKVAEEAVRESEAQKQTILDGISTNITFVNEKLEMLWVNKAAADSVGQSPAEMLGHTCYSFWADPEKPCDGCPTLKAFQTKKSEHTIMHAPDGRVWDESGEPVFDSSGKLVGVIEIAHDITERKQAEMMRESLLAELEAKNKEMEQIIYITSHDLRSPLVNIQGFSKELENMLSDMTQTLTEEDQEVMRERLSNIIISDFPKSLQFILASTSKMDSLLNGLLRLSHLGREELFIEELNMNTLVSDVISAHEFHIQKKNVKVDIGDLPPCKGDKDQIDQIFSNLLDNAMKYLDPEMPGVIKITSEEKDKQSVYCMEDNGIGISAEHQGKIFEIFHSLDPNMGGEGLGLTIIRRILDRHGGKIWLESEPGKGSKFYVSLPGSRTKQFEEGK